jgi:hypothetical protein
LRERWGGRWHSGGSGWTISSGSWVNLRRFNIRI